MRQHLSIPVLAALLFGVFAALAVATAYPLMSRFAREAGTSEWIFVAVPALLAALFALLVYSGAATGLRSISQSLSRGLLVAILAWVGFSAMATWMWCIPQHYSECFAGALMISGALGGGQLLLASLAAAAIVGYVIRARSATWKAKD